MKHLLFSLALTSTAIQSMEPTVFHNHDILHHITEQICNAHILHAKKDIISLAKANKTLFEYYSREKTQQSIVRQIALHKNLSDSAIAQYFRYTQIRIKINRLFNKINLGLTQADLQDSWYLNSTIPSANFNEGEQETLLLRAIRQFNITTVKQLIIAGIDCNFTRNNNPFFFINNYYIEQQVSEDKRQVLFDIIELLLKKNVHPDCRIKTYHSTLLHLASSSNDQRLARLLLQYGADPYLTWNRNDNAFELECGEPKGWLTAMVHEIERGKKNS
jgi:ankyrin repeat protein